MITALKNKKLEWVYYVLIIIFLLFLIISSLVGKTVFSNYLLLVVRSNSMEPSLPQSRLVLIKKQPDYLINEIVTYSQPESDDTITHRIVGKQMINNEFFYLTQGDNNQVADGWIQQSRIIGEVIWSGFTIFGSLILLQSKDFWSQLVIIWLPIAIIAFIEIKKIYLEFK